MNPFPPNYLHLSLNAWNAWRERLELAHASHGEARDYWSLSAALALRDHVIYEALYWTKGAKKHGSSAV